MSNSTNINTYVDIKQQLDEAIAMGGAQITLRDHAQAVHWRMRAYKFRTLYTRQQLARSLVPGFVPTTPYDNIKLDLDKNSKTVRIVFRAPIGVMKPLDGGASSEELAATVTESLSTDPLMLEALSLMEKNNASD